MSQQPNKTSATSSGSHGRPSSSRVSGTVSGAQAQATDTAKYVLVVGSCVSRGTTQLLYTRQWGGQVQVDNGTVVKRIIGSYHDFIARKIEETAKAKPAATFRYFPDPVAVPLISAEEETTDRNTTMLASLTTLEKRGTTIPGQQESSKSSAPFFLLMGYTRCSQAGTWNALWLPDLSHTQILAYDGSIYSVMPQLYYQSFYHQARPQNNPVRWLEERCTYMYTMPIAVPLSAAPHAVPYDASNMLTNRPHVRQRVSEGTQSQAVKQLYSGTPAIEAAKPYIPLMPPPVQRPVGPPAPHGKVAIQRAFSTRRPRDSGVSRKPESTADEAKVLEMNQFRNVQELSGLGVNETVVVFYKVNIIEPAKGKSKKGPKKVTFYTKSQQGAPVAIPEALLQRETKNVPCKERYWGQAPPISKVPGMQALESGVQKYAHGIELIYAGEEEGLVFPTQAG